MFKSGEHITVKSRPDAAYTVGQTPGSLALEWVSCRVSRDSILHLAYGNFVYSVYRVRKGTYRGHRDELGG